jgi:hypothetical protein
MLGPKYFVDSFLVAEKVEGRQSLTKGMKRFEGYGRYFGLEAFYKSFLDAYG